MMIKEKLGKQCSDGKKDSRNVAAREIFGPYYFDPTLVSKINNKDKPSPLLRSNQPF